MPGRTQPKITEHEGQYAINQITDRRVACSDPELEMLDRDNPLTVLNYVLTRHQAPDWVLSDDVLDALRVLSYLRGHLETLEHRLLELGLRRKITLKRLAGPLGLGSPQAVEQRILRARAADQGLPRSERAERAERRKPPARMANSREARWYDHNALKLWEAAAELAGSRREYDALIDEDLAESLIELQQKVNAMPWPLSPEGFPVLRVIAARIRLLLEDLNEDHYATFRQKLGDLLPRLAQLAADQRAAQYDDH